MTWLNQVFSASFALWGAVVAYLETQKAMGNILGSFITGFFALVVAHYFTKRIKQSDATLEFSRRFHELKAAINLDLPQQDDAQRRRIAADRWVQFFDLMFFQYHYFERGLLFPERFETWMVSRFHDTRNTDSSFFSIQGTEYLEGWRIWTSTGSNRRNRGFVKFMESIHGANRETAVVWLVRCESILVFRLVRNLIGATPSLRRSPDADSTPQPA